MLKRLFVAINLLLSLALPALGAGTIPFSMTQQFDQFGAPLTGCLFYTIQAGTTSTPQNAFKDYALTTPQPNPMVCDSSGRLPQFFLADGQIKIRMTDKFGNPQVSLDNILVIGPSSGGGSGATIDPTTIAATGDLKHAYGTQVITGWVRLNGRTIGNASSGATERANADTNALFLYLWAADANLTVSGGRTTAAADYAANKTITLPDARGRALAGLDDMGNTAALRLTSTYFGNSGPCSTGVPTTQLGTACGGETRTLSVAQLPSHFHAANISDPGHTHTVTNVFVFGAGGTVQGTNSGSGVIVAGTSSATTGVRVNAGNGNDQTGSTGSGTPLPVAPPEILVTIYQKL